MVILYVVGWLNDSAITMICKNFITISLFLNFIVLNIYFFRAEILDFYNINKEIYTN